MTPQFAVTRLGSVISQLSLLSERALKRVARETAAEVAAEWPVDTGESRDAWESEGTTIFNAVAEPRAGGLRGYAEYVHDGRAYRDVPRVATGKTDAIIDEFGLELLLESATRRAGR